MKDDTISWESPFGERFTPEGTFRRASGIVVERTVFRLSDLLALREAQRKLAPEFDALREAAESVADSTNPLNLSMSMAYVTINVSYRAPRPPHMIYDFTHQVASPTVLLNTTSDNMHPLVERLFPVRPTASLPKEKRDALAALCAMSLRVRRIDEDMLPAHIRIVFPGVIGFLTHWLNNIKGPITDIRIGASKAPQAYGHVAAHLKLS